MQNCQNQLDTTILDYNNLPPPPELNEALLQQLDSFIKGNWKESHQCITMIRSICKHYPQFIPDIFGKYGPAILELFTHGATQLLKNILVMLREVFSHGAEVNLQGCVNAFLGLLAKKAALESGHMREMAQEVLTIIANKCCYCNTIEIVTELSVDKNMQVAETAIKMLAGILTNLSTTLTQINPNTLQIIMRGMSFHIHGKRNNMKTSALDVCLFIFNNIGSQNYLQLMNYSLAPEEVKDMGEAMQSHRTLKPKAPNLSEVIKHQKMQCNQRQSVGWGQNIRM